MKESHKMSHCWPYCEEFALTHVYQGRQAVAGIKENLFPYIQAYKIDLCHSVPVFQ